MLRPPWTIPKKGLPKPTAQQRALAEWRRIDLREAQGSGASTKRMVDLLPVVVKKIGLEKKQSDLEVLRVWNSLLDPTVTQHAKPANLVRGTLFVNVDNSVWMDEIIRYRRKEILTRLQTAFGKDLIQRISFRLG